MPVTRSVVGPPTKPVPPAELVEALRDELARPQLFGQPFVEEREFPRTGLLYVTVVWDRWYVVPDAARSAAILAAYEQARGVAVRESIGASVGYTVPEGIATAYLRCEVVALLRATDPVTVEQCSEAMVAIGASTLAPPHRPRLALPSAELARQYIAELVRLLPGSEAVWATKIQVDPSHPYLGDE